MEDIKKQIQEHEVSSGYKDHNNNTPIIKTTVEYDKNDPRHFVKVKVEATIDGVTRKLSQEVVVNSYPDVLNYAAGSEGNLIINGSPYFIGGGLYAGNELRIKNQAEYQYKSRDKREATIFPSLVGTAFVQSLNKIKYCEGDNCNGSNYTSVREASGDSEKKDVKSIIGDTSSTQIKNEKEFLGINMTESFIDKLNEAISGKEQERASMKNIFKENGSGIRELMKYVEASNKLILSPVPPIENSVQSADETSYLKDLKTYKDKINSSLELENESILHRGNFNLDNVDFTQLSYTRADSETGKMLRKSLGGGYYHSNWFIIDGDLNILNNTSDFVNVRANILVTGNVNISGNVKMDATIFALGETNILDANIQGLDDKELVLMSKGKILITRVNTNVDGSFKAIPLDPGDIITNSLNGNLTRLDAFFYTDSTAELYGVGSIFWIKGGFFSKGDLTINAVRGSAEVSSDGMKIESEFPQTSIPGNRARFIVYYNNDIFNDQSAALPRVKSYNLIRGKKIMNK
ncbi:hypothetical protein [Paenibacillus sp. N3.4]|uniref:hypothetical protein n=1 Tax=Paenibacillus sp. N3.4 TaxID=2603222 RepID=UPI0011C8EB1C|nr:hypothetical protein [Paenibacillus sp. N3.4]TXK85385.1 hypothetical protein FU659_03775 [Paenibacillus sp. N3.4]